MSVKIKNKLELFINSVATILNSINNALNSKVDSQIYNNQTSTFQNNINDLINQLNILNEFKGLHFTSDQANNKIQLRNESNTLLTDIDVTFLNNEGTTLSINTTNNNLEIKNDQGDILSSVPVSTFVTNLVSSIGFNSTAPYKLELKRNDGTVSSAVDLNIENIRNLDSRLNGIKTLYNFDDSLTGNRNITIGTYYLKFSTQMGNFEIKDDKLTIPNKLFTNKFNQSQNGQILDFALNNNLPKILFGNPDIQEIIMDSKSYQLKNIPPKTTQNKTLCIDSNGNLAYSDGIGTVLVAGDGIFLDGNIISVIPHDQVELTFNW